MVEVVVVKMGEGILLSFLNLEGELIIWGNYCYIKDDYILFIF